MIAHTQYIYIITIQTIDVGLVANIFPLDSSLQILCAHQGDIE